MVVDHLQVKGAALLGADVRRRHRRPDAALEGDRRETVRGDVRLTRRRPSRGVTEKHVPRLKCTNEHLSYSKRFASQLYGAITLPNSDNITLLWNTNQIRKKNWNRAVSTLHYFGRSPRFQGKKTYEYVSSHAICSIMDGYPNLKPQFLEQYASLGKKYIYIQNNVCMWATTVLPSPLAPIPQGWPTVGWRYVTIFLNINQTCKVQVWWYVEQADTLQF